MKDTLKRLIIKELEVLIDKIKTDTCEFTEEEASDLLSVLGHQALSKEQACSYLNCSRATFDNAVKNGLLPKGIKVRGRKELTWYKDELRNVLKR